MNLKLALLFLQSIPDLIKLLQAIEDAQKEYALGKTVKSDLKTLHTAFAKKDGAAITALFSGSPVAPADPDVPAS